MQISLTYGISWPSVTRHSLLSPNSWLLMRANINGASDLDLLRDGLLPPFFSDINKHSQVPVKSTIATGLVAAILAFLMDVSQLAGMLREEPLTIGALCVLKNLMPRHIKRPLLVETEITFLDEQDLGVQVALSKVGMLSSCAPASKPT
ncbi:cationic amino acid transporter 2, vacuolar [Senna tora]|uniref:Cationic amino acid transporter 2, vacuolar n=1 Tax=Senna tora TaxID=362788 RepID=A0A834SV05_9FABA|nr:cationic amino acid transporter 2, vacuolar [Senna tora]